MHPGEQFDEPIRVREIWPPGTLIKGDFVIEKKIGSGGFGAAYLARHRFLGSNHVIKRLHEQFASDAEYVRKFMNEARAVRKLNDCPNVVKVEHMTQSEDGHLILVMEYVGGGDLDALLQQRSMTVAEVIEAGRQIAIGLDAAHRAGLIHRDIKPQNVLIGSDADGKPVLKLIDFGLAKDHRSSEQTSVMRGGSLGYAAPEQWLRSGKEIDGRADLYSLGASMYRMLCGRMPVDSSDDVMPWMARVAQGPPPAPISVRGDCPLPLSNLILEMLATEPSGRPADAATVIRRLDALYAPSAQAAEPTRLMPAPAPAQRPTVQAPPPGDNRLGLWAGAGLIAVASVAGIGWYASRPTPTPQPVEQPKAAESLLPPPETRPSPPPDEPKRAVPVTTKEPVRVASGEAVKKSEKPTEVAQAAVPPKPVEPAVNHVALGDAARNGGDFPTALRHYRVAADPARLAALQKAIEGDADERASAFMDRGQFAEAVKIADRWLTEFPGSQRLTRLRAKIIRARDSQ